jgi:fructose-specific phosphotransferase system IIA component
MKISDYITESAIVLELEGANKGAVLRHLVDALAHNGSIRDRQAILNALEERERLKTTGIGSGLAIPHCKSSQVSRVYIAVGLSKSGIDFESLDQQPAHLFFLLVAPESAGPEHLKASAKIVRLVRDESVRQELLAQPTAAAVLEYIKNHEETVG